MPPCRQQRLRQAGPDSHCGPCWLFFGCRQAEEDYLYRSDFEGFEGDGTLSRLSCAFSRAQQDKIYVQHLMREQVGAAQLLGFCERLWCKLMHCGNCREPMSASCCCRTTRTYLCAGTGLPWLRTCTGRWWTSWSATGQRAQSRPLLT